jgi:hypothetical protein
VQDMEDVGVYAGKKGAADVKAVVTEKRAYTGSKGGGNGAGNGNMRSKFDSGLQKLKKGAIKYFKFMGPGFMVSVAYIDPGTLFPRLLIPEAQILTQTLNR